MSDKTVEQEDGQTSKSGSESKIIRSPYGSLERRLKYIKRIAAEDSSVLFVGPTGTGKELLADYLVEQSPRKKGPYNKVNCIGLPEQIIESELFGHKKGSFTGAVNDRIGLIEASDNGTLFLDEIGVLPEVIQAKFLRVLEDKKIRKVGDSSSKEVNVRFIGATNKEISIDLKYRFGFIEKALPLNERKQDIPYLLKHFLKDTPFKSIDLPSLFLIALLNWEGNIRELKHFLKNAEMIRDVELSERDNPLHVHPHLFSWFQYGKGLRVVYLKRYMAIRHYTNFDAIILKKFPVKKIDFTEFTYLAYYDLRDELYLELNEEFPEIAGGILGTYGDLLNEHTANNLTELTNHRKDEPVCLRKPGTPSPVAEIRLKEEYLQSENKEKKVERKSTLTDLPWKKAQEEFRKIYWQEIHSKNPGLTNEQLAGKMGISKQAYQKIKKSLLNSKINLKK